MVKDDDVIHLADQAAMMGTKARDYFPQVGKIDSEDRVLLNQQGNYGLFISP